MLISEDTSSEEVPVNRITVKVSHGHPNDTVRICHILLVFYNSYGTLYVSFLVSEVTRCWNIVILCNKFANSSYPPACI